MLFRKGLGLPRRGLFAVRRPRRLIASGAKLAGFGAAAWCITIGPTVNLCSMETPEAKAPRPPEGLGPTGRALWRDTVAGYTFTPTELGVLRELCRAHDTATNLTTTSKSVSVTVKGSRGQPTVHPVFAEIRANQETIARLSRTLNLPDDRRNQGKRRIKSQPRVNAIQAQQARRLPAVGAMTEHKRGTNADSA